MERIQVLYVEPDTETGSTVLSELDTVAPDISVQEVASAPDAMAHLETDSVDCIVTEWDLPSQPGKTFLAALRAAAPMVPVVCFTHRSAEITAELFAFEATDYVQKQPDADQTCLLAARVRSAVESANRASDSGGEALEQYKTIVESVGDSVCILDPELNFVFVNEAFAELTGYTESELLGRNASLVTEPADMDETRDRRERLFAGETEATMLTGEITTADGTRLPIEAWMTSIPLENGQQGTVSVVRDVSFRGNTERMFTALYDAAHDLLSAQSEQTIAEIGVEAAASVLGFEDAILLIYDEDTNVFRPLAHTDGAESNLPSVLPIAASSTSIAGQAFFESELIVTDDINGLPEAYDPDTPHRRAMFVPIQQHGVLFVGDTETGTTADRTLTVAELLGATLAAAFSRLDSERESESHRRTLAEQTAELEALTHTNALFDALVGPLVSATTCGEIEAAVCSVLTSFDRYEFAWIGTAGNRNGSIESAASAGTDQGYLDWLNEHVAETGPETVDEPTYHATATGEPVSVGQISRDWQTAPWRKEALSRGYQSVLSVPLIHGGISYGVLSVYARHPSAFRDETETALIEFGRLVALVIANTETKQGLLTDHRTEVELAIDDSDDVLHRLAATLGATLSFEGFVPQDGDSSLVYFRTETVPVAAVEAAAEQCRIETLRVVTTQHDTALFEATVTGTILAGTLVDCGGIPAEIVTDGCHQKAVVTLPRTTDVRTFADRLRAAYPSATVASRQDHDGGPRTRETFGMRLRNELTPRQEETLRVAYFARYFDSPRGSTGTEVGKSLGISQPTFNYHLRAALRTLLTMLFEESASESLDV